MKHSKLGASSAKRWMNCPGSVALIDLCPTPPTSAAAREGTAAHALADLCLKDMRLAPSEFIGKEIKIGDKDDDTYKVTEDMAAHVNAYVAYIQRLLRITGGELLIEHRFHLSHLHPDLFGTCDAVVMEPFGDLHVIDFKYGAGIFVDAERNEQAMYYALGALPLGDFARVKIHIFQPRVEGEAGREWSCEVKELVEFGKLLRERAIAAKKKNAPYKSGEYCRFCPAAGICPELHKTAITAAQSDFTEGTLPDVSRLDDARVAKILEHKSMIEKWLKAVEEYALLKAYRGEKIPGLKLVRGRSRREWRDEEKALEYLTSKLGDAAYKKTMLSVTQAEKILGKEYVSGLFETVEGRITIAPESDRRSEYIHDAAQLAKNDFDLIETDMEDF